LDLASLSFDVQVPNGKIDTDGAHVCRLERAVSESLHDGGFADATVADKQRLDEKVAVKSNQAVVNDM